MNIKIENNALRFKISDNELTELRRGKNLETKILVSGGPLVTSVSPAGEEKEMSVKFENNEIKLTLSPEKVEELFSLGRSRDGIVSQNDDLELSLQVDFRTQKKAS